MNERAKQTTRKAGWSGLPQPLLHLISFAQVRELPEGEISCERGPRFHWVGLGSREIEDINLLTEALKPFVTLPAGLSGELARNMVVGA